MAEIDDTGEERPTLDRRSALKKGALAAGIVAWTTPTVLALTPGSSSAQARVTGCYPAVGLKFVTTGSACGSYPTPPNPVNGNGCCSNKTYFVQVASASCGGTCAGTVTTNILSVSPQKFAQGGNVACPRVINIENCSSGTDTQVTVTYTATCPDGVKYQCTTKYDVECLSENTGGVAATATLVSTSCAVVP